MSETRDWLPESSSAGGAPTVRVRFGAFVFDLRARKLWRGETPVRLPSRSLDVLAYLVARRDRVVDKDEIVAAVWHDVAVTDDSLTHAVSVLRRALGDDPSQATYIETIPRRGYRFVGRIASHEGMPPGRLRASGRFLRRLVRRPQVRLKADPTNADTPGAGFRPPSSAAVSVTWPARVGIAAALLLLTILAVTLSRGAGGRSTADLTLRLQQSAPPGTTIVSGAIVSPAGRHVAFVARDEITERTGLWLRALEGPESRLLPGTDDAAEPFWSPDGRSIAFFARGRLMATELSSGDVRAIAVMNGAPGGGSWGERGAIVFADWTTGVYVVDAAGGPVRQLTQLDQTALDVAHVWPQWLPDGRRFLYHVFSADSSRTGVFAGSTDGDASTRLLDRALSASYVPPGFLLYVQHDMLLAEPFDAARLRLGGRPVILARDIRAPSLNDGNVISGSRDLLAFRQGRSQQRLTWVDRSGTPHDELDVPVPMFNFRLAPNGRHLLAASSLTDATGLWLLDLTRRESTRLEADGIAPLWSPSGDELAFTSRAGLDLHVRRMGDAAARLIVTSGATKVLNDWSPDSGHIVYTQHDPDTKLDLWRLPVAGGPPEPLLRSSFNEVHARVSPDGRWIAYASDESGVQEVYVRRYPELDDPQRVSLGGGAQPQWRTDQRELFYLSPDGALFAVTVASANRVSFGPPRRLFRTSLGSGPSSARDSYAVAADGRSFLVDARHRDSPSSPITIVINWTTGLPGATRELAADTSRATALAAR